MDKERIKHDWVLCENMLLHRLINNDEKHVDKKLVNQRVCVLCVSTYN